MLQHRVLSAAVTRVLLLAALVVGAAYSAPPAGAAKPVKVEFPVEYTYEIPELSELCGFEVWFALEGTFKGILFRNKAGTIIGEFDSQPHTWLILYSPETGESFRNPFATTFHNRYPEGVDPGDRVIASATGFLDRVPGLRTRAGRLFFPDGEVLFLDDGVPIVDYGQPSHGTPGLADYDFDEADALVCAALAP